jgi:four helix bundle protein
MAYRSFEDLEVWQRGCRLAVDVFQAFDRCKSPGLKSQVERSALSIPSNIAEGAERGGAKEFGQFLKIAKCSSGELRTQLYIAGKLKIVASEKVRTLVNEAREISAMTEGLRKSILRKSNQPA